MSFALPLSDALRATVDLLLLRTGQGLALVMLAGLVYVVAGAVLPRWMRPALLAAATVLAGYALNTATALLPVLLSPPAG